MIERKNRTALCLLCGGMVLAHPGPLAGWASAEPGRRRHIRHRLPGHVGCADDLRPTGKLRARELAGSHRLEFRSCAQPRGPHTRNDGVHIDLRRPSDLPLAYSVLDEKRGAHK